MIRPIAVSRAISRAPDPVSMLLFAFGLFYFTLPSLPLRLFLLSLPHLFLLCSPHALSLSLPHFSPWLLLILPSLFCPSLPPKPLSSLYLPSQALFYPFRLPCYLRLISSPISPLIFRQGFQGRQAQANLCARIWPPQVIFPLDNSTSPRYHLPHEGAAINAIPGIACIKERR